MHTESVRPHAERKNKALQSTPIVAAIGWKCGAFFMSMDAIKVREEIERRLTFVKDALIGQSPEDLPGHYKLIGRREAFEGLLKFIDKQMDAEVEEMSKEIKK